MSDKSKIFSLFQEFSKEKKNELEVERDINSDTLLVDGMNTFMRVWSMYPTTNENGDPVSAGMYIYTIEAGSFFASKKMIVLK